MEVPWTELPGLLGVVRVCCTQRTMLLWRSRLSVCECVYCGCVSVGRLRKEWEVGESERSDVLSGEEAW